MQYETASAQLREAMSSDADDLFHMAQLLATSATPRRELFDQVLTAILHDPKQHLLVAQIPSGVVGYLYGLVHPAFHANGNIAWVEELFVESEQRGGGLGRQLMASFENWARRTSDATYVAVATRRADDFYESIGYAESATYFKKNLS